jgi:hypothetical protein
VAARSVWPRGDPLRRGQPLLGLDPQQRADLRIGQWPPRTLCRAEAGHAADDRRARRRVDNGVIRRFGVVDRT